MAWSVCADGAPQARLVRAAERRLPIARNGCGIVRRRDLLRLCDVHNAEHCTVLPARNNERRN